ncbi:hypothetical protein AKO1_010947 [Acrasis kona]|uniref:Uncharacterized protein n=1 Tax=Acrasis kona TaxID=1008807 RepID=A0AAW2YSY1_9EUKA
MRPDSLHEYGILVLSTNDTYEKAEITKEAYKRYEQKEISFRSLTRTEPPEHPARPSNVKIVEPKDAPKRGGGSLGNRIALLHSLCHMESYAIDLSWDIISQYLPDEFAQDWLKVAHDEAKHFNMLEDRLKELGSFYGDVVAHDGLWNSATRTSSDLLARLAVLHCVHEARGLDVTPNNIRKFSQNDDSISADLLNTIYEDEITHVTSGVRWFKFVCEHVLRQERSKEQNIEENQVAISNQDIMDRFYQIVRGYFNGPLKAPFNDEARRKAGMTEEWYYPLTKRE